MLRIRMQPVHSWIVYRIHPYTHIGVIWGGCLGHPFINRESYAHYQDSHSGMDYHDPHTQTLYHFWIMAHVAINFLCNDLS